MSSTETSERLVIGLIVAALGLAVAAGVVVTSAVSVLLLPVPFALMAGAGLALLALHEPRWALLLTFLTMPFERMMALFPAEGTSQQGILSTLTVTKVMLLLIVPIWLVRTLVLKDSGVFRKTFASPGPTIALVFAFYTTISLVNAVSLGSYLKNQSTNVSNVVLFIFVLNVMDDKRWVLRSMGVLFLGYVAVGLMGVYEVTTQTHILELMGRTLPEEAWAISSKAFRPAGPSGDPDYFATSILFGLMLTLAVWRFLKPWWIWLALLCLVGVFLFNIFATGSRGAMLGFLVGMAAFFWFLEMPYKVPVLALAIVGGLAGFTSYTLFVSARAAGRYSGGETKSLDYRLGWQRQCFGMIEANPVFGVGMGNSVFTQDRFFDPRPPRRPYNAANSYVQLAAEAGIPSVVLYLGFVALVLLLLMGVIGKSPDPEIRHLATCLFAALGAFFVFAATAHALYNELTWSLLGLSVSLGQAAPGPAAGPAASRAAS
jgi:O-antigen ligase